MTVEHRLPMTYHFHVIASSPCDAVINVGGWLFDSAIGGWQTKVMIVGDCAYSRAIRILGAPVADLDGESPPAESCYMLAVAADLYGRDVQVRQAARRVMRHDGTDLLLWEQPTHKSDQRLAYPVQHRLSTAARAFKAEALAAAGAGSVTVGPTETVFSGAGGRSPVARVVGQFADDGRGERVQVAWTLA